MQRMQFLMVSSVESVYSPLLAKFGCLWLLLIVSGVLLLNPQMAESAGPRPLPGWTHDPAFSIDSPDRSGLMVSGGDIGQSSAVIAEIDGNRTNGNEVAIGGKDGMLYVLRSNGTLLWSRALPNRNCARSGTGNVMSSPAVGELWGDGVPYVVMGYGGVGGYRCDGGVVVVRGTDGQLIWNFSLQAYRAKQKFWAILFSVISTPALADVDHDGIMEIAFGGLDRNVYLLNANGTVRYYYNAADTVFSSAAFVNVDNDRNLELIIGTDISSNTRIRPRTFNGGHVIALKTTPRLRKNPVIGFRDRRWLVWETYLDQVVQSSPTVADIFPAVPGLEIAIGTGCFFPQKSSLKSGRYVAIINAQTGAVLQRLLSPTCSSSSPAVGDIDNDGQLEVVSMTNGSLSVGGDNQARVIAWDPENPHPKWITTPFVRGMNDTYLGSFQSPVIADLDGNGSLEVVLANSIGIVVLRGDTGESLTCTTIGCNQDAFEIFAWDSTRGTPAIGDIDNDGDLDLVIGGGHFRNGGKGMIYAWTNFSDIMSSPSGGNESYHAPTPQFRTSPARSGASM